MFDSVLMESGACEGSGLSFGALRGPRPSALTYTLNRLVLLLWCSAP